MVIDRYLRDQDFEIFSECLDAWKVVLHTGNGDYQYFKHQTGDKISLVFGGFKSTAICAIIDLLGLKDTQLLMKIRLIEKGALAQHD